MLSRVYSCVLNGLDGRITEVEVDISNGLPGLVIVGLPDTAVKESKERIRSAINNSGFEFPMKRITINLAPANTKKEGTHFDVPMALGILQASKQIKAEEIETFAFFGELSLNGKINKVRGALPLAISLRNDGFNKIILPKENAEEAGIVQNIEIYPADSLIDVVKHFNGEVPLKPYGESNRLAISSGKAYTDDFSDVMGQEMVKRAFEIGAAGGHNIMLLCPLSLIVQSLVKSRL